MATTERADGTTSRFELRGTNVFVNGERLPVSRHAVLFGVRAWQSRTGELVTWTGGVARIDASLAREILAAERDRGVLKLAHAVARAA